jgi:CDP-glucose 4,6-dehydratase
MLHSELRYVDFFKNKKVLIIGHTGFKGYWLSLMLHRLGAELHGVSLPPPPNKPHPCPDIFKPIQDGGIFDSNQYANIVDVFLFESVLERVKPDIIFHMAAQALVLSSYDDPYDTFTTNVVGTLNLLEHLRLFNQKHPNHKIVLINVTTDKCYRNDEKLEGYVENDPLGGNDPYSASKAAVEIMSSAYAKSFFKQKKVSIVNVRAGNVIGGGDFSKDRILPDCVRAIQENSNIYLRNPKAIRPWQHVLDVLNGYLMIASAAWEHDMNGEAFNFGPKKMEIIDWNVLAVVQFFIDHFESQGALPLGVNVSYDIQGADAHANKETKILLLSSEKANDKLGWQNILTMSLALGMTADWYKYYLFDKKDDRDMFDFTMKQIDLFLDINSL